MRILQERGLLDELYLLDLHEARKVWILVFMSVWIEYR